MSKYIIEVDDNPVGGLFKAKGFNALVFDQTGLDKLQKYEEPKKEEVKEERSWPQKGDTYYYINPNGAIIHCTWFNTTWDLELLSIGNVFRTKEEAEFAVEQLKVLSEMRKFAKSLDAKWDGNTHHYCICYVYDINSSYINVDWHVTRRSGELYFESETKAMECIRVVGEDRIKKYYLGVK